VLTFVDYPLPLETAPRSSHGVEMGILTLVRGNYWTAKAARPTNFIRECSPKPPPLRDPCEPMHARGIGNSRGTRCRIKTNMGCKTDFFTRPGQSPVSAMSALYQRLIGPISAPKHRGRGAWAGWSSSVTFLNTNHGAWQSSSPSPSPHKVWRRGYSPTHFHFYKSSPIFQVGLTVLDPYTTNSHLFFH
jgi:hypothetical protein